MPKTLIRPMIRRDKPECIALNRQDPDANQVHESDFYERPELIGLVIEVDDAIRGWVLFERNIRDYLIDSMFVDVYFRRFGLATKLIDYFKFKVDRGSANCIDFVVDEKNLQLQQFLRASGLEAVRVNREAWIEEGDDRVDVRDSYTFEYYGCRAIASC